LLIALLLTAIPPAAGAKLEQPPTQADYGDAPDDNPAYEGGTVVDPAHYPTVWETTNAAPGRTNPYHLPLASPDDDFYFDDPPTYETTPPGAYQPAGDWYTPPCDWDDAPFVLCLDPACNSGVFSTSAGACHEMVIAAFGPIPPIPAIGFWLYEANRGAASSQTAYANVLVDYNLDADYGDTGGEWVDRDVPLTAPTGESQVLVSGPFPATTVYPCPTPLGWCVAFFWTRFHLSDEPMLATFNGTSSIWDGSGRLDGYNGGETEDVIVETDPQNITVIPPPMVLPADSSGELLFTTNLADPHCQSTQPVAFTTPTSYATRWRYFDPRPFHTGSDILTEIIQLNLVGFMPSVGQVLVHERGDEMSLGKVESVVAGSGGNFVSGESFFDVFFEIELPSMGQTLTTGNLPARLKAGTITRFPLLKATYRTDPGAHPLLLYAQGGTIQAGWLCSASLDLSTGFPMANYLSVVWR
jgi:hypothetical protein